MEHPARRLAAFVAARGISAAAAARALGVTPAAINKWVHGSGRPRPEQREAIARWTGGVIAAADWMTEEELAAIEAVEPAVAAPMSPPEVA